MADINAALGASKEAIDQLIVTGERTSSRWVAGEIPDESLPVLEISVPLS